MFEAGADITRRSTAPLSDAPRPLVLAVLPQSQAPWGPPRNRATPPLVQVMLPTAIGPPLPGEAELGFCGQGLGPAGIREAMELQVDEARKSDAASRGPEEGLLRLQWNFCVGS
eukprot:scaffold770_cov255-Pinguiococcus_pyrenoidosus.AAC.53